MRFASLLTLLLVIGLQAAPIVPRRITDDKIQRVPDRKERIEISLPAEQGWQQTDFTAEDGIETRSFEPADTSLTGGVDLATVTILHGLWNASMEKMQHAFGKTLTSECATINASLWFESRDGLPMRLVVYRCEESELPFSALQCLIQGQDNFYAVDLYASTSLLPEGQLVRWAEFLKTIRLCDLLDPDSPCQTGIWSYTAPASPLPASAP